MDLLPLEPVDLHEGRRESNRAGRQADPPPDDDNDNVSDELLKQLINDCFHDLKAS